MFDEQTEVELDTFIEETTEARREDDLVYYEGCTIVTAPVGPPPEYISVSVDDIDDPNVHWRGVPPTPAVGDEVLVWENPISHRREICAASGASGVTGGSVCQKITVAVCGGDFTLLSAAITWIGALAAGPSATRLFAINVRGGTFVEAGNVTVPSHVAVGGEDEATVIDLGTNKIIMSSYSSLNDLIITSDLGYGNIVEVSGDDVELDDVRVVSNTDPSICVYVSGNGFRAWHVICESTIPSATGFYFDSGYGQLWDCEADDFTNFARGLRLAGTSTVTTKFCEFVADGDDVAVVGTSTWNHFMCQFDPDNSNILGTENPLVTGKANFDDVVYFEDGLTMDGLTGANLVTIPDNQAQAFLIADDGVAAPANLEYVRIVSTNAAQMVVFNFGEADVDFRVASGGGIGDPTYALFVQGSSGFVSLGRGSPVGHLDVYDNAVDTTVAYRGIYNYHIKTAGATNAADDLYGLYNHIELDHVGTTVGHMYGMRHTARVDAGDVGDVANSRHIYGEMASLDLNDGKIWGNATGFQASIDQEIANEVTGDVRTLYLYADLDGTIGGTSYMVRIYEASGIDWCIYQSSTGVAAPSHLAGRLSVGGTVAPLAQAHFDQSAAAGNVPAVLIDQGDLSEQHIVCSMNGDDQDFPAILQLDVTGTPTLWWDESADSLIWNKNFVVDGNVGIGIAATNTATLYVFENLSSGHAALFWNDGNNADRYGIWTQCGVDDGTAGMCYNYNCVDGDGGWEGGVRINSGTVEVWQVSARRFKEDVKPTRLDCLGILNALEVVDFTRRPRSRSADPSAHRPRLTGFVAEDVAEVFPRMVAPVPGRNGESFLGLSTQPLIPLLVKSIQDLSERISQLERN